MGSSFSTQFDQRIIKKQTHKLRFYRFHKSISVQRREAVPGNDRLWLYIEDTGSVSLPLCSQPWLFILFHLLSWTNANHFKHFMTKVCPSWRLAAGPKHQLLVFSSCDFLQQRFDGFRSTGRMSSSNCWRLIRLVRDITKAPETARICQNKKLRENFLALLRRNRIYCLSGFLCSSPCSSLYQYVCVCLHVTLAHHDQIVYAWIHYNSFD